MIEGSGIWAVLNARSLCNKLDDLSLFLSEQNIDICCVTETRFNSNVPDSLICPKGYAVFRYDRSTPGGGVAIFQSINQSL